ncbi:hypothetical protein MRB53_021637 [Persea americana]|uniref:Uncharacterized protein n=1 Tax=Persea americana TaxID=3435 RepID=A0ACC2L4S8_PERAE|nr:hypothetical protein MRB53_021637 [Persea americana]
MLGGVLEGLSLNEKSHALYLYPWALVSLVRKKNSGSSSGQIPYYIPAISLYDFADPNEIPGKDCPFAIDGERYYFTKQVHRDASGKRSKRKAGEQGAYWKSTSTDIAITDLNGKRIGYVRKYTLYEDKDDKRSANWYMEEYRVHDAHELVDPYVLCKIYDKDSSCPKFTETSIQALTKRIIESQHGSHPDQTNSLFDNRNQSQTHFDGSNSHEDTMLQPPSEKSPPESILPTSDNKVFPMLHGLSNEFSMSPDPSGNLNPPESIRPIPRPPGPPDYSYGFSTSHGASGNQNHPASIPSIPWNSKPMNQFQTQSDNSNFVEDHIMQPTFPTSEDLLSELDRPIPSPLDSYSNEYRYMTDGISNGPSMTHSLPGNPNAVDGEESSLDCFSDQLWNRWNF